MQNLEITGFYPTILKCPQLGIYLTEQVLIYNGDLDPCVPYNGNEEWTRGLGLNQTEAWHPWFSDPGTGTQIAVRDARIENVGKSQ